MAKLSLLARLIYIGTWTYSDDYGVVKGNHNYLKSQILPFDDIPIDTFKLAIKELEDGRRIIPFIYNEEHFYFILNFKKHQKINRPSKQRYAITPPEINSLIEDSVNTHGALTDETETESETETETESEKPINIKKKKRIKRKKKVAPEPPKTNEPENKYDHGLFLDVWRKMDKTPWEVSGIIRPESEAYKMAEWLSSPDRVKEKYKAPETREGFEEFITGWLDAAFKEAKGKRKSDKKC